MDKYKHPELITNENLIKILDNFDMYNDFFERLKRSEPLDQAIWYTLRNRDTNLALKQYHPTELGDQEPTRV
jgi:hypothetical protein